MATITKRNIVVEISNDTGMTQVEVKDCIELLMDEICLGLQENRAIELRGFGTFFPKVRKPRPARNIHTGEVIPLKKRVVPLFRYSSNLKTLIDKNHKSGTVEQIFDV